jgi:plastocyanin domain-containing protein
VPARVTFLRKVEATCGTELLIPDYQIKRDLPFNEPVVVEFTPNKRGESEFTCGMKMLRGKIVVR